MHVPSVNLARNTQAWVNTVRQIKIKINSSVIKREHTWGDTAKIVAKRKQLSGNYKKSVSNNNNIWQKSVFSNGEIERFALQSDEPMSD